MMKLGGIHSGKEVVNFLLHKVGDLHITSYVDHVARQTNTRKATHTIVQDIHTRNFPAGCYMVHNSAAISMTEAIFEMKTYTTCNSKYNHSNNIHPADWHARIIVR